MELESAQGVIEQTETFTSRRMAAGGDEQYMDEDLSSRATLLHDGNMLTNADWVDDYDANEVAMTEQEDRLEHEMEVEQGHDDDVRESNGPTEHAENAQEDPDKDADYDGAELVVRPGTPPSDAVRADNGDGQPADSSIPEAQSADTNEETRSSVEEAQRHVEAAEGEAGGTIDAEEGPYATPVQNVHITASMDSVHHSRGNGESAITNGTEEDNAAAVGSDGEVDDNHSVLETYEDKLIQPVRITFNDQDFVLFSDTQPSSYLSADGSEERVTAPALQVNSKYFYESLDSFVEALRIREALGDFFDEGTELKLSFEGLSLCVCEDDVYAREVTLEDIARICHVLGHHQSMHIIVTEKERFITRYNELATQISSRIEHALDEASDSDPTTSIDKTAGIIVAVDDSAENVDSASAHAGTLSGENVSMQKDLRALRNDLDHKSEDSEGNGFDQQEAVGVGEAYDREERAEQREGGEENAEAPYQVEESDRHDETEDAADKETQSRQDKDTATSTQSSKQSAPVLDDRYEEDSTSRNEAFESKQEFGAHQGQAASADDETLRETYVPADDAYDEEDLRLHEQESGEGGNSNADHLDEESVADYEDAVHSYGVEDDEQAAYEDDGEAVHNNKRSLDDDEQDPTGLDFDANDSEVGETGDVKRVRYDDEAEQD